jgi:outer membrane lipoprotein-sorting protein
MKKLTVLLCLGLLIVLLRPLSAQTVTAEQVLKNMEQGNAKNPMLQADVQKRMYAKAFNDLGDPEVGKIWILRSGNAPRRIKVDFEKPKESYLIDKNSFLHYKPATKEAETKSFTSEGQAEGECIFLGLCQSASVIEQHYDPKVIGEETIGTVKTTELELKSKDIKRSRGISSIRLWLDPSNWIPLQTRIYQESGNYTEFRYSNFSTAKFSDSVFDLKLPRDASITTLK